MSEQREKDGIRISQVLAGALAAVTAALVGSTMGVAGTIVGAGLASIVSTVGGALYLASIQRTSDSVRTVRAKVVGRSGDSTVLVSQEGPPTAPETSVAPPAARGPRWPMVVVGSLAAFALGMLAVTGIEWLRGESLSGGTGTTFSSIVERHPREGGQKAPTRTPSAPPPTSTQESTTAPETTTPPPPSSTDSSEPPTTTPEPPTTTTTEEPSDTVPPTG